MPGFNAIRSQVEKGVPGCQEVFKQFHKEYRYYRNHGADFIRQRNAEDTVDYKRRKKLAVHITYRVITELAKGLYAHPGPSRKVSNAPGLDKVYQDACTELKLNAVLHKADAMAWLHGWSAIQVVPSQRYLSAVKASAPVDGICPIQLRLWRADETWVWTDDEDPSRVIAVAVFSVMRNEEKLRMQVWTDEEFRTYHTAFGDDKLFTPDKLTANAVNSQQSHEWEFQPAKSGKNEFGVVPFVFYRNEVDTDQFHTDGLGCPLVDTCEALDDLLSDLNQSISVFCIPERLGENVATADRVVSRPGNITVLTPIDPSKPVDIKFPQPELNVEAVWTHVENTVNELLESVDVQARFSVQTTSQPESGVALAIRRIPLIDKWRARQGIAKDVEKDLVRMVATVYGKTTGQEAMVQAGRSAEVEVDFPEYAFPFPSTEQMLLDEQELKLEIKSLIGLVKERTGKTEKQAEEHILEVREQNKRVGFDPASVEPAPPAPQEEPVQANTTGTDNTTDTDTDDMNNV